MVLVTIYVESSQFPFLFHNKTITINSIELHLKLKAETENNAANFIFGVTLTSPDNQTKNAENFTATPPDHPLHWAPIDLSSEVNNSSIWVLEAQEIDEEAIEDIFVVCHYTGI